MLDVNGNEIGGRVCFNSGYIHHVKQVAAEIMSYGIDGFHFDMMDQGFGPPYGCWCPKCQAAFEEEYGRSMPKWINWDAEWKDMLEFRYKSSARFEKELYEFVRSENPDVTVDFNYHGSPPFSWEVGQRPVQHAHVGDFVTGECGTWAFGPLHTSLAALFAAATKPDAVYQIVMQRSVRTYHDMTVRPVADMRWEAFTLLSHGAQVTIVDKTAYDGSLDPVVYDRIGQVFAEGKRKQEHFGHKPFQEVGLYYSSLSRDWYGKDDPDKYQISFLGAHKALVYEHIPTGVILDENVSLKRLKCFPVVYLPNIAVLRDEEVKILREYVHGGGNLLATGFTGLYGELGEELSECALGNMLGAKFVEKLPGLDNHISLTGNREELHLDIPSDWPFLVYGQAAIFKPVTAEAYGMLYQPHRVPGRKSYHLPLSADTPVGPAILINSYGDGKVVYLPCSPDAAIASEYRTAEPRFLIRNAIRYLNPEPDVEVSAPLNVESVITEDEKNRILRIHLISYLSPAASTGPGRPHSNFILPCPMEEAPIYRAKITVRRPFRDVSALSPDTQIEILSNGIELLVSDIHETIVMRY